MRGKLKELWHRHLDRKPWIFRDQFGLAYLFTAQDEIAEHYERSAVIDNPALLDWLQANVKPGQTFVDLSPVIGGVTMLAARQVQDSGAVFAFAPDMNTYRQLVNNVALNGLTRCVRVVGRDMLSSATTPSLDRFASEWQITVMDFVRVKNPAQFGELLTSAADLLKRGAIHRLIMDEADAANMVTLPATLRTLGFDAKLFRASGNPTEGQLTLIATRAEGGHA